jgi:hypothetical protein
MDMPEPDLDPRKVSRSAPLKVMAVHGDGFNASSRLALIEDGWVWCLELHSGMPTRCRFLPDSSTWLETNTGAYALVGQAITKDGESGGECIMAARVNSDGTVPGVDMPSLNDAVGLPADVSLGFGQGVIEQLLSASNVTGFRLENVATRQVCTGSNPHPDGAELAATPAAGVFCYRGRGAGLNDINGWERDEAGNYRPAERFIHYLRVADFEAPAGKRPATGGYPPKASPTSQILWRLVDPRVRIAN